MKKLNPAYLAFVFLLSAILFVACSKEELSDKDVLSKINVEKESSDSFYGLKNKTGSIANKVRTGKCVTISLSIDIITVSTEVCCWRWTSRSPIYACSWGSKKDNISLDENTFKGYIDVEQLGSDVLRKIDENKLNKLKIRKSFTYEEDGVVYKVKVGDYLIEKDEAGRFIKVDISIKEKTQTTE